MENRFANFKVTFLSISAGVFAGMIVYGLLDKDFSKDQSFVDILIRSLVTAITIGLVMGILNMFFRIDPFQKKEKL